LGFIAGAVCEREAGGDQTMNHPEAVAAEQRGQTMAEYAVVLTVITISIVATLALLTSSVTNMLNQLIPLI
jgi:Flp pilus assembly pilin Flp